MRKTIGALLVVVAACMPAAMSGQQPDVHVRAPQVRVICPMTVGGSFEARSTALGGSLSVQSAHPLAYAGTLTLDLRTLDTGIDLRTSHMKDEYLEVGKGAGYDKATLSDIQVGDIDPQTFQGRTFFTGDLLLHGTHKPIRGQADVKRSSGSVRVDASFPLKLTEYGIAKPQYLGVGVRDQLEVKVSFLISQS